MIFLLDPHQDSKPLGVHLWGGMGTAFSTFIVKFGQLLFIAGMTTVFLVWKKLINAVVSMKQVR